MDEVLFGKKRLYNENKKHLSEVRFWKHTQGTGKLSHDELQRDLWSVLQAKTFNKGESKHPSLQIHIDLEILFLKR